MIIYNSNYEFVAISDAYVKKLNFPSFNAMKYRFSGDFANLFIEKKGFVSNFKHILWIDYILQEKEKAQAIIKGGDNSFYKISMSIETLYFLGDQHKGFLISILLISEYENDTLELDINQNNNNSVNNKNRENSYSEDDFRVDRTESAMFFDSAESQTLVTNKDVDVEDNDNKSNVNINKVSEQKSQVTNKDDLFEASNEFKLKFDDEDDYIDNKIESKDNSNSNSAPKSSKLLTSPDEFFKSFETETASSLNYNSNVDNSQNNSNLKIEQQESENLDEHESKLPLKQIEIDDLINGKDIVPESRDIHAGKYFSSDHYNLDDVSVELNISRASLIDFLIDFIYHSNQIKKIMYEAIENNQIELVKNGVFFIRGLALNLRIVDIYDLIEKIINKHYKNGRDVLKDINSLYKKISFLKDKLGGGGDVIRLDTKQIRPIINSINKSSMPDSLYQELVDTFIKLFDNHKDKIENGFNQSAILSTRNSINELQAIAKSLSLDEVILPIENMIKSIDSNDIKFEKLIMDWIDLSTFITQLRS